MFLVVFLLIQDSQNVLLLRQELFRTVILSCKHSSYTKFVWTYDSMYHFVIHAVSLYKLVGTEATYYTELWLHKIVNLADCSKVFCTHPPVV